MANDNLRRLYNTLVSQGFTPPAFEQFAKDMEDEENLRRVHATLQSEGYTPPKFETFKSDMGFGAQPVQPAAQSQQSATPTPQSSTPKQQTGWKPSPVQMAAFNDQVQRGQAALQKQMDEGKTRLANIRKGGRPDSSFGEVKFNPSTGTMGRTYYTIEGDEVATPMQKSFKDNAWRRNWEATTPEGKRSAALHRKWDEDRRQQVYDGAMWNIWVNGAAGEDVGVSAAETVWSRAAARQKADAEKVASEVYKDRGSAMANAAFLGGRENHIMNAAANQQGQQIAHFKNYDLDRLMDEAWAELGKEGQAKLVEYCYNALKKRYPNADDAMLRKGAQEQARYESDMRMYNTAVEKNMPKDNLEYLFRKVMSMNTVAQLGTGINRSMAGTTGDMEASEQAMAEYDKDHKVLDIVGTVGGFAVDPLTTLTAGIGGVATKGALWLGGRYLFGRGAAAAGARYLGSTLTGRMVGGAIGGGVNFGTYEAAKEGESQFVHGGHINPETGENEGYSFGEVAKAGGHGLLMGGATGWITPYAGNVSDKIVRGTSSTAGKIAGRAGIYTGSTVVEGTIFGAPEIVSALANGNGEQAVDVWTDNIAMIAGFKGRHMFKSGVEVLEAAGKSRQGRMGIESRLREWADRQTDAVTVMGKDGKEQEMSLRLTKDEKAELEKYGYDLNTMLRKPQPDKSAGKEVTLHEGEAAPETIDKLKEMLNDPRVSEAARAKMYYYATGHILPVSTIMGGELLEGEDGKFTAQSYGANGIITSRTFDSRKSADLEMERIGRQAELNQVEFGERYTDEVKQRNELYEAGVNALAAERGWNAAAIRKVCEMEPTSKELEEVQKTMRGYVQEHIDKYVEEHPELDGSAAENIRTSLNERFGVDIDQSLRKEPKRRSVEEQEAIDEYIGELFPEQKEADRPIEDAEAEDLTNQKALPASEPIDPRFSDEPQAPIDPRFDDGLPGGPGLNPDGTPMKPVGRATMKFEDRQVEVLNGRVVMFEDGTMVDNANSDQTIIIRDIETGKVEMVSPEAILTYEDYPVEIDTPVDNYVDNSAESAASAVNAEQPRYSKGRIVIRNTDGTTTRGWITDVVTEENYEDLGRSRSDIGKFEYYVEGDLQQLHYATADELDGMVEDFQPDMPVEGAENIPTESNIEGKNIPAPESQPIEQPQQSAEMQPTEDLSEKPAEVAKEEPQHTPGGAVMPSGATPVGRTADGRYIIAKSDSGETIVLDNERGHMIAHNGEGEQLEPYRPGANVGVWNDEQLAKLGEIQPLQEQQSEQTPAAVEQSAPAEVVPAMPENVPNSTETPISEGEIVPTTDIPVENVQQETEQTPLQRIPRNEKGEPLFEQAADHDEGWDALVEFSEGDKTAAKEIADVMVDEKRKAYEKAQKLKSKGKTPTEILASRKANAIELAKVQDEYERWQKIASVEENRQAAIRSQQEAEARQKAIERAEAEKEARAAAEEAARKEREALEGIPEWHMDTPENARARGVRRYQGQMYTRQEPVQGVAGKEVEVKFSQKDLPKGKVAVIEASQLQPSHVQGQRNPMFFIDEAQPKNRSEAVSTLAAKQIAEGVRPEEITGGTTAYTGAPTVNTRGEVIQGNNRSDALRYLWENHLPEQQSAYKQHLIDNAEKYGLDPEAVNSMQKPVLVNMLDVDDAEAIRLGQMTAQDTESGGIERINPKNVAQKLGDNMRTFANQLLRSSDEEASFGQLVDRNGAEVLGWMNQVGAISNTQYQSAFDSKGNLTAEAKNDLQKVLYQAIFKGGSQQLEEMFDKLPAKAQRALLATAFRDMDSPFAGKLLPEIQSSIAAYNLLMSDPTFAAAKNMEGALRAVEAFKATIALDDRFEQYMPADNFSNFALHLAAMYKASDYSQSRITSLFNEMYDLAQGKKEATLFEEADTTEYPLADVIKKVLDIDYKPAKNGNYDVTNGGADVALRNQSSQGGELRGNEPPAGGEQNPRGAESPVSGGGASDDSRGSGDADVSGRKGDDGTNAKLGKEIIPSVGPFGEVYTQFKGKPQEAVTFLLAKRGGEAIGALHHKDIGDIDLVWGEEGTGHSDGYGLAKLAKFHPEVLFNLQKILDDMVVTKRSDNRVQLESDKYQAAVRLTWDNEKKTWLLTMFEKKNSALDNTTDTDKTLEGNGNDTATPKSTVISSEKPVSASSSDIETEPEGKRNGTATPQGEPLFGGKVNTLSEDKQISGGESSLQLTESEKTQSTQDAIEAASAEVDQNPTEAQKEAGNYKKGHVSIGDFDITIENPAGSVRSGVDGNGQKWETKMANAYGYIKGTESVDGDHIDVFLAENMDDWDGRKVYVVDQTKEDGTFDEHKVMLGFNDGYDAKQAYLANYDANWEQTHPGLRISEVNIEDFKKWIESSHRKTKPFADYSTVKKDTEPGENLSQKSAEKLPAEGYKVVSKPYTNKSGKTLDTYLVTFDRDFSKEELSALRAKAKEMKGWRDKESGGWMLRSEADAKTFAEEVMGKSAEEIEDEAPLSMTDMGTADSPVKKVDVEGLIGDLKGASVVSSMTGGAVDVPLSDHATPVEQPKPKKRSKWISEEDADEFNSLRNSLRNHLGADDNIAHEDAPAYGKPQLKEMDPEVIRMGTRMTYLMLKGGLRKFSDYAEAMVEEIGDAIRPHLKSLYGATQNTEEVMALGWDEEMDDRKTVKAFDVYNFDKEGAKDIIETAQHLVDETESQKKTEQIVEQLKEKRNEQRKQEADKTSADTEAIAGQAEATASTVESELHGAKTSEDAARLNTEIDKQIEDVNRQLALLGNYAKGNEAYNERHAESDAAGLMARLANDLGIDLGEASKEGQLIKANFGPIHGYVTLTLPLKGYEPIKIEISFAKIGKGRVALETFSVRRTITNSDKSILGGGTDIKMYGHMTTYRGLLNGIKQQFKAELEAIGANPAVSPRHGEDYVDMAGRIAKQKEKDAQATMGSLFDFEDEAEVSKQITDAVKSDLNKPVESTLSKTEKPKSEPKATTEVPVEKQWREMKKKHPDALVLMRVGNFYETFGGDAADIAKILGVTLTRKAGANGTKIEMAGFLHHELDSYLPKLVRAGKRVAIAEKLEKPKEGVKRTAPVRKPKEELSGTSAEYQEKSDKERDLVDDIRLAIVDRITNANSKPLTMAEVRKMAEERGIKEISATDLQELVERAVSLDARAIAELALSKGKIHPRDGFDRVVNLYEKQPMLTDRDSERVAKQQYSTPVPMGYVMNQFLLADGFKGTRLLEPSAGNGALTIGIPMEMCHVNDIDARRLANLRAMGYPTVTNQDGTQPFAGQFDMVATNPPFGGMTPKQYGLFTIDTLDGQMAINALQSLSDNGRAAIIIGGSIGKWPTPYRSNGSLEKLADRQLFGYLYSHFNVVDIIPIDGKRLYARNGTGYNVRMILIDGRRRDKEGKVIYEATKENRAYPPVMKDARAEAVTTFDELYNRVQDDISRLQTRMDEPVRPDGGTGAIDGRHDREDTPAADSRGSGDRQRRVGTGERGGASGSRLGGEHTESAQPGAGRDGRPGSATQADESRDADPRGGDRTQLDARTDTERGDGNGSNGGRAVTTDRISAGDNADRVGQRSGSRDKRLTPPPVKVQLTDEKVASPHISEANHLMSRMPAAQAMEFESALQLLQAKHGNIDEWLVDELGYADKSDLFRALAAEQIEGVAMAIDKMADGRGFIIADQTGIGKGRQAASIIRYGVRQGKKPIFFTQKPGLFSDMYRDLCDVGSPDLRPFIFGSKNDANITTRDASGQDITVFKRPTAKETERVFDYIDKHGELPPEYDYAVITYSQIQNGTVDYDLESVDEFTGKPKTNPKSYKKGIPAADKSGQRRRDIVEKLANDNFLILDEAHTAGGQSGTGGFMQSIIADVRGVTYLSATYAKRPDNMPLYAIKTAISESGVATNELIQAVSKGGVPLQEIMSRQLVKSGEMVRRERDFTGVSIDWIETDAGQAEEQRKRFDTVAEIFGDIMRFEQDYVQPFLANMSKEIASMGEYAEQKRGKKSMGIDNTPFASKLYNLLQQLLFTVKVDAIADRAIKNLEAGRKPIISFVNTMEGFLKEAQGEDAENAIGMESMPTFAMSLRKALEGVLHYTRVGEDNSKTHDKIPPEELGDSGLAAYNELMEKINAISSDLPIAPLDAIRIKIEEAGYTVRELSGRSIELAKEDGKYYIRNRAETDKKKAAADFNDGKVDVLMVNKTGSTGISLHASEKFADKRQRVMIAAQLQPDVNDEIQMRGRNDRTGQVQRGAYEYLLSSIPAEQRLQMMFKAKLKSLDANTTSSQKSSFNDMDIVDVLNKYGDQIVYDYLMDDISLNYDMGNPLKLDERSNAEADNAEEKARDEVSGTAPEGFARKALGRLALLSIAEQERVMEEISDRYVKKIRELDERGENDLEISYKDLKAKTIESSVWIPGSDPDSGNAFADNVNVEKVEVNILAKPMTLDEVKGFARTFIENDGVSTWEEWVSKKTQEIDAHYDQRMQTTEERIRANHQATVERRRAKLIADGKAQREKGKHSYSDAEIEEIVDKRIAEGRAEAEQQLAERIDRERTKIDYVRNTLKRRLNDFKQMQVLAIPDNLTEEGVMNLDPALGVFVGMKFDKKFTLAGSSAVFAPLDGRRTVTVSLKEGRVAFPKIFHSSAMMRDAIGTFNIERDWNNKISKESREERYMLTGNILRALVDSEKGEKTKGRIMTYTTEDGEIRTGILMPAKFTPNDLQSEVPISEMSKAIKGGTEVKSSNGEVTVRQIQRWSPKGEFELLVPRSKQRGGKYYLDDRKLLSMVVGGSFDIPRSGANAIAPVTRENLDKVLKHLSEAHGIKVMQQSRLEKSAENANFAKEPTQRYETEDGREINYTSENPEGYGGLFDFDFSAENAGGNGIDSRAGADGVRLEDNPDRREPGSGLDKSRGEFAVVERVFKETGSFSFTSGEKIESAADVAFIFSALEDAAKEHTFAVYVKAGKPTVVELGMGAFNMSIADVPTASLAYNRIKPDAVYFVHNHPTGNLKCSPQDAQLLQKMQEMCDVPVHGVIINLKTGKYGTFDTAGRNQEGIKREPAKATALTIHTLDKQIFAEDYDPEAQPLVTSPRAVAEFLNSHRMGDRAKVSFLILSQAGRIVGNIHTPFTDISTSVRDKARYISDRVIQFGGAGAILYGDFDMSDTRGRDYRRLKEQLQKVGNTRLLDVVSVEGNHTRSANDEGILYEPGSEYGGELRFRIREEEPPRKTGIGYKVFVLKDGKLYPPMVANPGGEATPVGVWLDADAAPVAGLSKTGRQQVKAGGKGTQGGSGKLAYRPGWHLGQIPYALQFNRLNPETGAKELFPANFVWAEVEYANDVDYQEEAMSYGMNGNGKFQHSLAGMPRLPENGSYTYRTNPNPETDPWIITGAMKVNRLLTPSEVDAMVRAAGREPQQRQEGAVSDAEINALNSRQEKEHSAAATAEAKRSQVEGMSKRFNTPVRIVENPEELTHSNGELQRQMRRSKGFYDPRTGEVVIVLPNNKNVEDVAETMLHETVAHKGLRELVGEENYDAFCDEVYDHLKEDLKEGVDAEATRRFVDDPGKGYESARREAVDEMFGRMAEKDFEDFTKAERSIWAKLKQKVLEAINKFLGSLKLPKWVRLGDNELRYMLWKSHERMTGRGDYVEMARDAAKRQELGVGQDVTMRREVGNKKMSNINEARLNDLDPADAEHSAKVAKRIETTKKELRQLAETYRGTTEPKGFLTDLGQSLGAIVGKSGSGYRTFELTDGSIVKIRISTHNANAEHARSGEPVVSIVIKPKRTPNTFVEEPGKRVSEYVYFKEELRKAPAGTLSKIAEGLSELLDTGEYKDKTGLARENHSEDIRFRDSETGDIWKDRSVGLEERITNAAVRLANNQSGDLTLRNDAMRAIGGNLTNLRRAMALQRTFDQTTVKRVADLARILIQNGYLSGMTSGEVQRLLSAVKNSVGHREVKESVQKVMDIMIQNQLRNAEGTLRSLLAIRGSKVDSRGVEVQGVLDVEGQRLMEVVKKAMSLKEDDINDRIAEALNRMSDPDNTISDQAAIEYAGLHMALEYVQNIVESKAEEKALRDSIRTAKEDKDAGRMTVDAHKQFVETTEDAIRKNRIERAEAYFNLVGRLSDSLRGSIENAKAFREVEKARVQEIHHNANSDMEGRPTNEHHHESKIDKLMNNGIVQFLFAPLGTFDQILRVFGNKSASGEGYLWNRFMRGWVDSRNKELQGVKDKFARLDGKAAEIFGKGTTWGKLIRMEGKLPKATVSFWDGGEMRDHELTQGNLMYIYMVDKMSDGRMKLRRMGITEDDVTAVENMLDPRFKELADWLQDEFLVDTRNEYNETHKRMFGASMAAIENYFPLKILANARIDKEEDVNQQNRPDGITTKTGSIIKRRVNNLALDITGADALTVILDHITQMEHWNAYAEWNRDLNTLRTYKRFRNQVMNMTTVYGGGRKLWQNFNDLCLMAAGEYRPPVANLDKSAVNIAKGVTAAKVSFRVFTALKQLLSAPAYAPEVSMRSIAKSIINPYGDFKWCMENLPIFRERWHSRISGDPRLLKSDIDWKMWRSRIMQISSRIGMTPNAFVDAVTVAIGARAMYDTRLRQYLKEGYPSEMAEQRAKQDATILFNQTQQSSESPFLATMQVDRSWLSTMFTIFRNASISYGRQEFDAMRNLKRNITPGQRAESVAFMKKQILRDWDVDPDTATDEEQARAESAAKRRFRRQMRKDIIRVATFGFILQLLWNLGPYMPYLFFGNDDDDKKKMWDDAMTHAYFGSVEGLTGGDVLSSFGNMAASGDWSFNQLTKDMPVSADVNSIINKFIGGKNAEAFTDIFNLLVQSGVGMNPQSITDTAVAILDACGDDPALSHEAAIFVMRVLQVPQSQLDKMYFDEIGLSGEEASKLTPEQLAERYATYKVKRGTPYTPWAWGDEERLGKYEKVAEERIKEHLDTQGYKATLEAYADFEERYKAVEAKAKEVRALMKTDYVAAAQAQAELQRDPDFVLHQQFKALDKHLARISKLYLKSQSAEEAAMIRETVVNYREAMVRVLQAGTFEEQERHMAELTRIMTEFSVEYQRLHPAPTMEMKQTKR